MSGEGPFRIGVLTPMPSEQQPLVRAMSLQRVGDDHVYRGTVGGAEIISARTGMGTQRARDATARLLDSFDLHHVMVVGIAGGMGSSKVGDVLFPESVVNKHTESEYRPAPLGGVTPRGKLVTHDDF